jgi:hypothetical protein
VACFEVMSHCLPRGIEEGHKNANLRLPFFDQESIPGPPEYEGIVGYIRGSRTRRFMTVFTRDRYGPLS